jgi:hypothetical protein
MKDCNNSFLERLAQGLEDMAAELGEFIQEEHAVVRQRHVPRRRHLAATDQPHIRNGVQLEHPLAELMSLLLLQLSRNFS